MYWVVNDIKDVMEMILSGCQELASIQEYLVFWQQEINIDDDKVKLKKKFFSIEHGAPALLEIAQNIDHHPEQLLGEHIFYLANP